MKRGQAASWEEGGTGGRHKHPHMDEFCATPHCYQSPSTGTAPGPFSKFFSLFDYNTSNLVCNLISLFTLTDDWASLTGPSLIPSNLLPPFSVSATAPNQPSALFRLVIGRRLA